ncbi:hypothetical protein PMAYCL1PPCAC_14193, partial [Pristionchus mayeri]
IILPIQISCLCQLDRLATTKCKWKINRTLSLMQMSDIAQVRIPQLQVPAPRFFRTMDGRHLRRNEDIVTM